MRGRLERPRRRPAPGRSRSSSIAQVRAGQAERLDDARVQLAGVADERLLAVDRDDTARRSGPGARGRTGPARTVSSTPGLAGDGARRLDGVGPVGRAALAPPAGLLAGAREDDGGVPRLARAAPRPGRRSPRRWDGGRRAAGRRRLARRSGRKTRPVSKSARSWLPRPSLRRSAPSRPGSSVVRSAGSSSESGLTSLTVRRRGVVRLEAELVEDGVADERVVQRLDVTGAGQRAADAAVQPLAVGEPAAGGRLRQGRREVLVALQPDDLFGQVVRLGEVGPPGRHGDDQLVLRRRRRSRPAGGGVRRSRGRTSTPATRSGWSAGMAMVRGADGAMISVTPASAVPPASRTSRSTVRCAAAAAACGSTPRSKRLDASEDSLWRRAVRAMEIASKCAASMTTSVVPSAVLGS